MYAHHFYNKSSLFCYKVCDETYMFTIIFRRRGKSFWDCHAGKLFIFILFMVWCVWRMISRLFIRNVIQERSWFRVLYFLVLTTDFVEEYIFISSRTWTERKCHFSDIFRTLANLEFVYNLVRHHHTLTTLRALGSVNKANERMTKNSNLCAYF